MTASNHALTGAAIATMIKQPVLALPLAFLSHFLCDGLPHFGIDMKFASKAMYRWLVIDVFVALVFGIFLLARGVDNPVFLALGAAAAMSPDLFWLYYGVRGDHTKYPKYDFLSKFHHKIQWSETKSGILVELVWAVLMLLIILKLQ